MQLKVALFRCSRGNKSNERGRKVPHVQMQLLLYIHPPSQASSGKVTLVAPSSGDVTAIFCCVLALFKWNVCLQLSTAWLINRSNYLLRQTKCAVCLCPAVFDRRTLCPDEGTETGARQPGEKSGDDDSLMQVLF